MLILRQLRQRAGLVRAGMRARVALSELTKTNQPLSTAVIDAVRGKTSKDESDWIERIEDLRRRMNASSEEVEFMDYGAGSGELGLTQEQMYQGRAVRRTIGQICSRASRTEQSALLLFRLIRELKPRVCIELGTALGISACYQAAALKLNGAGKLVSLEGAASLAAIAARNFTALGLDGHVEVVCGRFQDTLPEVLAAHPSVDYAFIDGHHDEAATVRYFNAFLPALAGNAVVVFDDIQWSEGMRRAWDAIRANENARATVNLGSMGLITVAAAESPRHFELAAF